MEQGVQLHIDTAGRIFRTVRHVEDSITLPPTKQRRVLSEDGDNFRLVQTTVDHLTNQIEPCKIMTGELGSEIAGDETIDCLNRFVDLDEGEVVIAVQIDDGWHILPKGGAEPLEGYLLADLTSQASVFMQVYEATTGGFSNAGYSVPVRARGNQVGATGAYCIVVMIRGEWRPVFVGCV